ncbi:hypothetical protein ACFY9N_00900 [Microbacterium sp. NPDC008134]|uniref:hypothetical protein n=1 Tax=Microbacterium sp. NPDC008134 TaxID=3364183 RepID=UPI0036E8B7EF
MTREPDDPQEPTAPRRATAMGTTLGGLLGAALGAPGGLLVFGDNLWLGLGVGGAIGALIGATILGPFLSGKLGDD